MGSGSPDWMSAERATTTGQTASSMALFVARKMERNPAVCIMHENTDQQLFKTIPAQVRYLNNAHKEQANNLIEYFKSKEGYLKCVRLDA